MKPVGQADILKRLQENKSPLVPANSVTTEDINVKTTHVGTTYTGMSADDIIKQINAKFNSEPKPSESASTFKRR